MTPEEFIAAARSMLGVRYKHQGRDPRFGIDCAGLAVLAARQCGVEVVDYNDYERTPKHSDFVACLLRHCEPVPAGMEKPGDLLVFRFAGNPQHLAILTGPDSIIHALAIEPRKVVEHFYDDAWRARRVLSFRVRG